MTSKAERKRRKKQAADPFALAPVERREKSGRKQREPADRDPSIIALEVRCNQAQRAVTPEAIREMRAPWWGCNAGKAIASLHPDERAHLWDAICHMRRVITAYDRAIGAPSRHAVCMRLLAPVDALEADASSPPLDERTEAEKQRQAVSALMALEGWLGYADKQAASEAKRVVWDDGAVADRNRLLNALRCASDGMRGQPLVYRGC